MFSLSRMKHDQLLGMSYIGPMVGTRNESTFSPFYWYVG